jgi:Carboxypeptidase regulatory-like domain
MLRRGFRSTYPISIAIATLALSVSVWAQGGATGAITGTVKDSTGAVIAGANVSVMEEQTGSAVAVKTQADGAFFVPQLLPATYRVTAESAGFKRLVIDGLKVDVGTTLTQDMVLEIGGTAESIEVMGQASMVETASGEVGTTVQVSHVLEMPLVDRNVFNLVNLVPTAVLNNGYLIIGGGRAQSALSMVDGVQNTRGGLGVTNSELSPPVDSMQEFKVEVSSFGAEYGHTSAGLVKAGTNGFHGSLYEFVRNNDFDAAGWGADHTPPLHRNNFGGTIGGPIRKNKTFFFITWITCSITRA